MTTSISNGSALVQVFHETYGQPIRKNPTFFVPERAMRMGLIDEEFEELCKAQREDDFIEIVDAWADLVYVIYGAGKTHGLDVDHYIYRGMLGLPKPNLAVYGKPVLEAEYRKDVHNEIALHYKHVSAVYKRANTHYAAGYRDDLAFAWAGLVVAVYNAAREHNVDLNEVLLEVQRSNLSKLGTDENGNKVVLRREDGKILKGPDFSQPDILEALRKQGYEG